MRLVASLLGLAVAGSVSACSPAAVPARVEPAPQPLAVVEPSQVVPGQRLAQQGGGSGGAGAVSPLDRLVAKAEKAAAAPRPIRVGSALPRLVPPTTGRSGTGLLLGAMEAPAAPVGGPVDEQVTTAVANIPNRTSAAGFASSLRALTRGQDFVMLNEVSGRDLDTMRALAPAYGVYRDPVRDAGQGGSQSLNNVVLWREDKWNLLDAGRVKVVDDDRGFLRGKPFVWDRYLTWAVLQRSSTGAIVSVASLHMPTNPAKYPEQPGGASMSRVQRYSQGMDRVLAVVRLLNAYGPVLLGGDMNSHPGQGEWTAEAKLRSLGFGYAKDRAVMYLFHPPGTTAVAHREVPIASDHPAIVTTIDLGGAGPVS